MVVLIIIILMVAQIVFRAIWEANLLTPGTSDHRPKYIELTILCGLFLMFGLSQFELIETGLLVLIYPFLHEFAFDYALNHFRGLDLDYKTRKTIYKVIALLTALSLMITFLKLSYS